MNISKKFGLIELFFLGVPMVIAILNAEYSSITKFVWWHEHVNEVSMLALFIAIIGNLFIFWQNRKYQPVNKIWGFVSIFLVIILAVILYIGNSISNFGF